MLIFEKMPLVDAFHAMAIFWKILILRLSHYLVPKYIILSKKADKQNFFALLKAIKISICQIIAKKNDLGKNFNEAFWPKYSYSAKKILAIVFFHKKTQRNRKWENFKDPPVATA